MRITIETTEAEMSSANMNRITAETREAGHVAASNGGAAPEHLRTALGVQPETTSGAEPSSSRETDAGSPPFWLMDAVTDGVQRRYGQEIDMPTNGTERW